MQPRTIWFFILFVSLSLSPLTARADPPWQNENLSENPWNNIHNDSWFTDSYRVSGPTQATGGTVELFSSISFDDPDTGQARTVTLGDCGGHAYITSTGNYQGVCAGFPNPITNQMLRSILQFDSDGNLVAYRGFTDQFNNIFDAVTNFGGAGYFYQDKDDQIVMGMPNGHVVAWKRKDLPLITVDPYVSARDIAVIKPDGPIPEEIGSFYALLIDKGGFIWFTTSEGVVGTIAPDDSIRWIDVNVADPGLLRQRITEAHSINQNTMYQETDQKMYRFDRTDEGTPEITWSMKYDRGTQVKPGQTSRGSGTSPSYFEIGERQFVTIFDNARRPNIVVYRADELREGETRRLVKASPFGGDTLVSNENSLVVYAVSADRVRIYAENNWGNTSLLSTAGPRVTRPGYGGIEMDANGLLEVLPPNKTVRIPSVVSKGNVEDKLIYTYNKTREGWFLTALDANDLNRVIWTIQTGSGATRFNSWYAQLSLSADMETFYIGTAVGFLKVTPNQGPPNPGICFLYPEPKVFTERMRFLGQWTEGPAPYANFTEASFIGFRQNFISLWRQSERPLRSQLVSLIQDLPRAQRILQTADYNVAQLSTRDQTELETIADRHNSLLLEIEVLERVTCSVQD